METPTITFDQLPHVVSGLSEKLDRVLDILEKVGIANPIKNAKPSRRLVYAKEACQISHFRASTAASKLQMTPFRATSAANFSISTRMNYTHG